MQRSLYEFESQPYNRPSFLTWLCILTFIGSGWAILSSIWYYSTATSTPIVFSDNRKVNSDSANPTDTAGVTIREKEGPLEKRVKASFSKILKEKKIRKWGISGFIASLFTLSGALLMWKLKRIGYYIYIVGVIIGIVVPFYLFGNDLIAVAATSYASFFGLIFIALYALNLKSMSPGNMEEF